MNLDKCWLCGSPAVGTGHHAQMAGVPIGLGTVGVCDKHIASVVLFEAYFEDHTDEDAEYDWLRDKEVKEMKCPDCHGTGIFGDITEQPPLRCLTCSGAGKVKK